MNRFVMALCIVAFSSGSAVAQASADAGVPSDAADNVAPMLPDTVVRPTVTRTCTPDNPLIGQSFDCTVVVTHSDAFSVNVAVPAGWESDAQVAAVKSQGTEDLVTSRVIRKTPLSMRKVKVFGFAVSWTHVSGARGQITIPDEFIAMRSMMADVDEPIFRDFRAPTPDFEAFWTRHGILPLIETNWFVVGLVSVLVLALLGAMIMLFIQKRLAARRAADIPWVDPRPAHIIAEAELSELAEQHLPENGETLAFYLRLSEILRTYLENRFGLAVARGVDERGTEKGLRFPAATSEEIEAALKFSDELTPEGFKTLLECLSLIDYVIFGGVRPHVGQTEADRRRIRFCVELTKVREEAPESHEDSSRTLSETRDASEPKPDVIEPPSLPVSPEEDNQ